MGDLWLSNGNSRWPCSHLSTAVAAAAAADWCTDYKLSLQSATLGINATEQIALQTTWQKTTKWCDVRIFSFGNGKFRSTGRLDDRSCFHVMILVCK